MAKKRKLNKKVAVLLGLAGVLVCFLVAVMLILRYQPKDPAACMQRGAKAAAEGNYAEAAKNYRDAANAVPTQQKPEHLVILGELLMDWLKNDPTLTSTKWRETFLQAKDCFQQAVRYDPKNLKALRHIVDIQHLMAIQSKDWAPYLEALDNLIKVQPDDLDLIFQRALGRAQAAPARPDYYLPKALADFKMLVKAAPQKEEYWIGYVEFCRQHKDLSGAPSAEDVYAQARKANKDSYRLTMAYATMLARQPEQKAKILPLLNEAVEKSKGKDLAVYLTRADYYVRQRELAKAKLDLDKAQAINPGDYRPCQMRARILLFEKDYNGAQKTLEQGLEQLHKTSTKELAGQALQEHRNGLMGLNHDLVQVLLDGVIANKQDPGKVRPRIDQALREMRSVDERNPAVLKVRGQVALLDNKPLEAEKFLRESYESSAGVDLKTMQLLINLYSNRDQLGEARKLIEQYLSLAGNDPTALTTLMRMSVKCRQYDAAAKIAQTIKKIDPKNETVVEYLAGLDAVSGGMKPPLRVPQAVKDMCKPPEKALDRLVGQMFVTAAERLRLEGNHAGAVRLIEDVLECDPNNLSMHGRLVQWLREDNDQTACQQAVQRAKNIFKDNPNIVRQFDLMLATDPKEILAKAIEEAKADPDPVNKNLRLAAVYRQTNDENNYSKALKDAEAAAKGKVVPALVAQLFDYALAKKNWAEAGKYAELAAQADLDGAKGRMYQARLARAQDKWDDAIRFTADALRERPRFSEAHAFLGDCYLATEKVDQAQDEYETAHDQNPTNVAALVGLMRVAEATGRSGQYAAWVKEAYTFVPNNPEIRERYLQLIQSGTDPQRAIRIREERSRTQPNDVNNLIQLAELYYRQQQVQKAENIYRKLAEASPNSPTAIQLLANFLRATNRSAEGLQLLTDWAGRAEPKDKATAMLALGQYLEDSGNNEAAKERYLKAAQTDPQRGYMALARFAARHQQWDDAVTYHQKYLEHMGDKAPPQAQLQLAELLIQANHPDQAHELLLKILGKSPRDVNALTLQGKAYLAENKLPQAKEALDQALKENPSYAAALSLRAEVSLARNDAASAVADLEKARETQLLPAVSMRLADIYAGMKDFPKAQSVLQSFLAERPDYAPALQQMIQLCRRFERWNILERTLAEARKTYPNNPVFLVSEGDMWRARNEPARAVDALEKAQRLAPNNSDIALMLLQAKVEARQYQDVVRSAETLRSDAQVGPMATAVAAMAQAKLNEPAAAEASFLTAIKDAKDQRQIAFIVGRIRQTYSPAEAVEKLGKWRTARPNDLMLVIALAGMYEEKGDYKASADLLKRTGSLAKTNPEKLAVYRHMGMDCQMCDMPAEATKWYRAALAIEPNDPVTLNNLAWLLAKNLNRPDEALPLARQAVQLMPDNSDVRDTLGYVLLLKGNLKEAETELQRSVAAAATSSNRLHLGMVYERMNRPLDALRQYDLGWDLVKGDPKGQSYQELRDARKRVEAGGRTGK